jgi:hypothetical protein
MDDPETINPAIEAFVVENKIFSELVLVSDSGLLQELTAGTILPITWSYLAAACFHQRSPGPA